MRQPDYTASKTVGRVSRRIVRRPRARQDIVRCALFVEEAAAERLLDAIEHTLGMLADLPGLSVAVEVENSQLAGLRRFPVSGFDGYLLFYRASDEEIELVRLLHGTRDEGLRLA